MPATSQQGFSCEACIRATGAVDLLCTFADGAPCANRVGTERFSITMTEKANVVVFFVITDLRLTQPSTFGKVVSALQPPTTGENSRSHFLVGRIVRKIPYCQSRRRHVGIFYRKTVERAAERNVCSENRTAGCGNTLVFRDDLFSPQTTRSCSASALTGLALLQTF